MSERQRLRKIKGKNTKKIIELSKKYLATMTQFADLSVKSGKDCYITTFDDEVFLDGIAGVAVSGLGYGNPALKKAIVEQLETGVLNFMTSDFYNLKPALLAKELVELVQEACGDKLPRKVFLSNSGAEAIETAAKLLFHKRPERKRIISFLGAFHGRSLFGLSLMGSKSNYVKKFPQIQYMHHFLYPTDVEAVKHIEHYFARVIPPEEVNAIFIEFVQGEGGINIPNKEAIGQLDDLRKRYDILLVADEIQTGMGRTGKWFAFEHFGIRPDIITLGKALASGLPVGATVFPAEMDFEKGAHGTSLGGNLLVASAALATIGEIKKRNLVKNAAEMGEYIYEKLSDQINSNIYYFRCIKKIKHLGLMLGIEFFEAGFRNEVFEEALKRGLLLAPAGHDVINPTIRITPPIIISKREAEEIISVFIESLNAVMRRVR